MYIIIYSIVASMRSLARVTPELPDGKTNLHICIYIYIYIYIIYIYIYIYIYTHIYIYIYT